MKGFVEDIPDGTTLDDVIQKLYSNGLIKVGETARYEDDWPPEVCRKFRSQRKDTKDLCVAWSILK